MAGLLLKDFYMMTKNCRLFLLIVAVFAGCSLVNGDSWFFVYYPCAIAGVLPTTLCSYDEREKWCSYSLTLPVSRDQYVSGKYLIGLAVQMCIFLFTAVVQAARMINTGMFVLQDYLIMMEGVLLMALAVPAILLPVIFRLGTEKGRIAYYGVIVIVVLGGRRLSDLIETEFWANLVQNSFFARMGEGAVMALPVLGAAVLYGISWFLSIAFYRNREIA